MWNKQPTNSGPEPQYRDSGAAAGAALAPAPQPTHAPAAPSPPQPHAKQSAVIGPSMTIRGEIHAREELVVDGEVEGTLESQSQITVGSNGKVKSNIKAREVTVYGSVHGNVEVTEKISIRSHGSLVGDIKAAGISIEDGAYFKGSIDIVRPEPKVNTKPVKTEPAASA